MVTKYVEICPIQKDDKRHQFNYTNKKADNKDNKNNKQHSRSNFFDLNREYAADVGKKSRSSKELRFGNNNSSRTTGVKIPFVYRQINRRFRPEENDQKKRCQ